MKHKMPYKPIPAHLKHTCTLCTSCPILSPLPLTVKCPVSFPTPLNRSAMSYEVKCDDCAQLFADIEIFINTFCIVDTYLKREQQAQPELYMYIQTYTYVKILHAEWCDLSD